MNISNRNKCTLIVDGNWLFMSRFFNYQKYFLTDASPDDIEYGIQLIKDIMSRSITNVLNLLGGVVDNILFVYDGGSWRKSIYTQYKQNRIKDESINWDAVWRAANEFKENIQNQGITICQVDDLEGDDLIYYWSRRLNKDGINCIIWSTDRDLQQLVCTNSESFTAWLDGIKKVLVLHSNSEKKISSIEFMMEIEVAENGTLTSLKSIFKNSCEYINPDDIVMEKVICGDIGDNIKSIVQDKKGTKTYRVTEKNWSKIKSALDICDLNDFFNRKQEIVTQAIQTKNSKNTVEEALHMFDINTKLVWLNKEVIPINILKEANKTNYSIYDINNLKNNCKILSGDHEEESALSTLSKMEVPF